MRVKALRVVAAVVLGLTALASQPSAQGVRSVSVEIDRPVFASQRASQWCWAASVANLFAYHGHAVPQARIVSEVYGVVANMRSGDYANMARLLNRRWTDESGDRFDSRLVAALDIANGVNAIDNDAIRQALRNNRPLVIGTTTHAMLVVGMQYTEIGGRVAQVVGVDLFDPWPGQGFRPARRDEVTPVPFGGSLMFIADARVTSAGSRTDDSRGPSRTRSAFGRSCQTQVGRCGPFFDQPALPVGSSCYCATQFGPAPGVVVQ